MGIPTVKGRVLRHFWTLASVSTINYCFWKIFQDSHNFASATSKWRDKVMPVEISAISSKIIKLIRIFDKNHEFDKIRSIMARWQKFRTSRRKFKISFFSENHDFDNFNSWFSPKSEIMDFRQDCRNFCHRGPWSTWNCRNRDFRWKMRFWIFDEMFEISAIGGHDRHDFVEFVILIENPDF